MRKHTLLIFVSFLFSATLFAQMRGGGPGGGPRSVGGGSILPVTAERESRSHTALIGGALKPWRSVDHASPITGIAGRVLAREGQRVESGAALFYVSRDVDVQGDFRDVVVRARLSGLVSLVAITSGEKITQTQTAVRIIDDSALRLDAAVSDKDAFALPLDEEVTAETGDGGSITGTLYSRSPEPDYTTFLFEVTFRFTPEERNALGRYVLIDLPVGRTEAIFVKRENLVRRFGEEHLWVVSAEKTIELRAVTLGESFGDEFEITSGLTVGEIYLTGSGTANLTEGAAMSDVMPQRSETGGQRSGTGGSGAGTGEGSGGSAQQGGGSRAGTQQGSRSGR